MAFDYLLAKEDVSALDNGIWGNIRILITENKYTAAERKNILLRWQANILNQLPSSISNPATNDNEIFKTLFQLQQKALTDGDIVLLDTLRYLLVPGKFTGRDLNSFLKDNSIKYIYSFSNSKDPYCGEFFTIDEIGNNMERFDKIFISHSSKDIEITKAVYDLLGIIGVPDDKVFCSSIPECGIPLDADIYQTIKEHLLNEKVYVLFMLSENYYNSVACLNEMGAAWVLQASYTSLLLPGFDYSEIRGGINAGRISIKLDSDEREAFARLTELKDKIQSGFNLKRIDERKWNRKVYEFLHFANSL